MSGLICKKVYFTFGRFQPPTTGHKDNFAGVKRAAAGHDYRIYISQTHDLKGSNPLPPDRKLYYMNKMFPEHRGKIFSGPREPVSILKDLMPFPNILFLLQVSIEAKNNLA